MAESAGVLVVYPNGTSQASWNGTGTPPITYPADTTLAWNSFSYTDASGMSVPGTGVDDIGFLAAVRQVDVVGRVVCKAAV